MSERPAGEDTVTAVDDAPVAGSDRPDAGERAEPRARDTNGLVVTAAASAIAGGALWLAARSDTAAVVVVVAVLQVLLVVGWIFGLRVPGRWGGIAVCVVAAAGADVLAVQFPDRQLGVLVPPLGLLVLAVFVAQLFRGVVRVRVVESVSDVALLGVAAVALASFIPLSHRLVDPGSAAVPVAVVLAAGLTIGALADLVAPFPRFDPAVDRGLFAVLLGAVAGVVAGYLSLRDAFEFGPARGSFLGGALAVIAGLVAVGAVFLRQGRATDDVEPVVVDDDATPVEGPRSLAELAAEEVLVENDARAADASPWPARLQPVATALWTLAIAAPVGYLLIFAVGG